MKWNKRIIGGGLMLLVVSGIFGQAITSNPVKPTINDEITLTVDISKCKNKGLLNYSGDVYVHTGVITTASANDSDWKHVITKWDVNNSDNKANREAPNKYSFKISPQLKSFYGLKVADTVAKIAIVFRSSDGKLQTEDLFVKVYKSGLNIEFISPKSDTIIENGNTVNFKAKVLALGTSKPDSISLYLDETLISVSKNSVLEHSFSLSRLGNHSVRLEASNSEYETKDSVSILCIRSIIIQDVPTGLEDGINYMDDTSATLVLHAPNKSSVHVIGDFNNWELNDDFLLNKSTDGKKWWIALSELIKQEEYAFQYIIDGKLRIADPYTEKILDPVNDKYIPTETYPNLKPYPEGKTSGIVSVLQTGVEDYKWQIIDFQAPALENLVIYELHVQNFTDKGNIKTITDTLDYLERLGINAIELMPVNEFEGNISWGYNPSFYFAFDKMYGTKQDMQKFVDACHDRGIAVILDLVLNHSYSQSPMVQMYWDGTNVTEENPWYNSSCPHSNWCWGYDFNHESVATNYFIDRVNRYWLSEYKVDGYRFDFTKGFTNKQDANAWGPDTSRIAILKRMSDVIWKENDEAYVIFEHLTDNAEEIILSDHGIMLWGNMNHSYTEATMGYTSNEKSDFSGISYKERGWSQPHLIGYMESHDEERMVYKNNKFGNSNSWYKINSKLTAIQRIEPAAAFFFTVPGPKMIWEFGELGYDYSINTCKDGTVNDDCRLVLKPIRWDYKEHWQRKRLHKIFELLIKLKTEYSITRTADFKIDFKNSIKRLHLNDNEMHLTVIGNFGINNGMVIPDFQHTGTWYNYLTGELIEVNDVTEPIELSPGEYHVLTDKKLEVSEYPSNVQLKLPDKANSFEIYPNPHFKGINKLTLNYLTNSQELINFYVLNNLGQTVYFEHMNLEGKGNKEINIPLESLEKGIYIYRISSNNQENTGKLIIR